MPREHTLDNDFLYGLITCLQEINTNQDVNTNRKDRARFTAYLN